MHSFSRYSVLCSVILFSQLGFAEVISVRADSWFPFNGAPDARRPGYMIEIIDKAWSSAGYTMDYQIMSWDESIDKVRAGQFDCVVGAGENEVPDLVRTEHSLGVDDSSFFSINDDESWEYKGVESFKGKSIGVIEDYSYGKEIDAYIKTNKGSSNVIIVSGEDPLDELIELSFQGKVDIIIETPAVFKSKIKRMGLNFAFTEIGMLNDPTGLYVACDSKDKNSQKYVTLVSDMIVKMRRSGELKDLLSKYGLKDWEQPLPEDV